MRKTWAVAIFLLALIFGIGEVRGYSLTLTVEDGWNTKLYNTQIELLKGSTVVAKAFADEHGNATMQLEGGTYFARLNRNGYPLHVLLITLNGDSQIKAVMNNKREVATIYGSVIDASASHDGQSIYLLDDWKIAAQAQVQGGYFIFPYITTAQHYGIRLADGTPKLENDGVDVQLREIRYIEVKVKQPEAQKQAVMVLSAPKTAEKNSLVIATLTADGAPAANQSISLTTPAGTIVASTDIAGRVAVNAVQYGKYIFKWQGQTVMTDVAAPYVPETIAPEPEKNITKDTNSTAENSTASPSNPPQKTGDVPWATILGLALVGLVMLAGGILIGWLVYRKLTEPKYAPPKHYEESWAEKHDEFYKKHGAHSNKKRRR